MLHHVMLEIYPADLGRAAEFWSMLGFKQVDPPEDMTDDYTWFERDGTQIHLMRTRRADRPRTRPPGDRRRPTTTGRRAAGGERLRE